MLRSRPLFCALVCALLAASAQSAPRGPVEVSTAAEAAKHMGKAFYFGTAAGGPLSLLAAAKDEALGRPGQTTAYFMSTYAPDHTFSRADVKHFQTGLMFVSPNNRHAATGGWAKRVGPHLHGIAQSIRDGAVDIDTVIVRVSPPNEEGLVSLGETADLTMPAIRRVLATGGKVIAEVNRNVPFTYGSNNLPYDALSVVVRNDQPLPDAPINEHLGVIPREIAKHVASLIPKRQLTTYQQGIGAVLEGVGEALKDRRLVIWSEMGSDGMIPLFASEKPAARFSTFSFLKGGQLLRQLVHQNPFVEMHDSLQVNDPQVISQKQRMTAVNTALEMSVNGDVNAEEIDGQVISAPGGQPNFALGARQAPQGKSVIALRSLNKDGHSTIVLGLHGPTTTPADNVDYLVTEWGATKRMRGLSPRDRTYQIVSVAHPFYRRLLAERALEGGQLSQKQYEKLQRSVPHALTRAAPEMRARLADAALAAQILSPELHQAIVATVPQTVVTDLAPVVPRDPKLH